jgi:hypothetical protein
MLASGIPLTKLYIATGAVGVFGMFYGLLDLEPSSLMGTLLLLGPPVFVAIWLAADCKSTRLRGFYDMGLFFYLTWLVTAPWYLVTTRGRRGWRTAALLYALGFAGPLGIGWGALLRILFLQ